MEVIYLQKKIAHKVKSKMEAKQLSFRLAAKEVGLPYATLHRMVNNDCWPNARHLFLISAWLGEPADLFVDFKKKAK